MNDHKRPRVAGLCACLTLTLAGCQSGQAEQTEPAARDETALAAIQEVLLDQATYIIGQREDDTATEVAGQSTTIPNHLEEWNFSDPNLTFALCDMDQDGTEEAIVDFSDGSTHVSRLVLHYQSGAVYGYEVFYRGLYELKTDGTFQWSGGASSNGTARLVFHGETFGYEDLVSCDYTSETGQEAAMHYFADDAEVTQEDFDRAMAQQGEKPEVTWYDRTNDAVKQAFMATPHNVVCGALWQFSANPALQKLEIHQVFLRFCALS